jgi:hypothetical protein
MIRRDFRTLFIQQAQQRRRRMPSIWISKGGAFTATSRRLARHGLFGHTHRAGAISGMVIETQDVEERAARSQSGLRFPRLNDSAFIRVRVAAEVDNFARRHTGPPRHGVADHVTAEGLYNSMRRTFSLSTCVFQMAALRRHPVRASGAVSPIDILESSTQSMLMRTGI